MSEPLSSRVRTDREVALQAIEENRELRARVAELEKERDALAREYESALGSIAAERDRGLRAEAGLLTAQEALKKTSGIVGGTPVGEGLSADEARDVWEILRTALARRGGQQDTGQ